MASRDPQLEEFQAAPGSEFQALSPHEGKTPQWRGIPIRSIKEHYG